MALDCGCPESWPDWHKQDINLGGATAHILGIPTFLHMPLSYGLYVARQRGEIETLELTEKWPGLVLTTTGFMRGKIISILETANSPSRRVQALPMEFTLHAYLHNGGIGTVKESMRKLQSSLFDQGRMPKELYMAYLTCPHCEESRGGDKIMLFRRFEESDTLKRRLKKKS